MTGQGYRLKAGAIKEEFNRAPVMHLLLRYTQALITQMAQTAVCNRHHSLDQQLCRWLLLSLDRLQGNELTMTQELIANMLGVRREGVTEGAPASCRGRADPLRARSRHGARPPRPGAAHLRVLCGGQEGVRPPFAGQAGDLAALDPEQCSRPGLSSALAPSQEVERTLWATGGQVLPSYAET